MNSTVTQRSGLALGHLLLVALSLMSVIPIVWMVFTSLKPENEILGTLIPSRLTFDNYINVFRNIPIANMLWNTMVMAVLVAAAHLVTSLLAGYAFARWEFPGSRVLFLLFLGTWLVPFQVVMIPNYVLLAQLGWLNTVWGLVAPQLATAFGVIMLRQYVKGFPRELLDAAQMDGSNSWHTLWAIVVPNLRAPLSALAILYFISAWNEYFWPILITNKPENTVIQVGLQMFLTAEGDQWGALMAAATLASLPVLILYLFLQRQVIDAFIRSGIK